MGSVAGVGEMSTYQDTPTMRFNQNANFTGSMGSTANTGEVSMYQNTPTMRFNQNTNFTGSMGSAGGIGEMSTYQDTPTMRFNQNANFTGSLGSANGSGNGEVSKYQSTPTNRIVSNSLIGTGGDQIGGGGYFTTVTNPMSTMRVVSTNMSGGIGMDNSVGGYLAETTQNVPTYRQTQNFDYAGPIQTANSTEMTATGEAERNMFFRNNKQSLLQRLPPTPVNAFQGPTPESMYSMHLKNLPSTQMITMPYLPTTDYLPFSSKLKNIQIPTTYPNFVPAEMVYNNPYVNNVALKAVPNYGNPTVGAGSVYTSQTPNNNPAGFFNQRSNDLINNKY
jgi:hypothetical protein